PSLRAFPTRRSSDLIRASAAASWARQARAASRRSWLRAGSAVAVTSAVEVCAEAADAKAKGIATENTEYTENTQRPRWTRCPRRSEEHTSELQSLRH